MWIFPELNYYINVCLFTFQDRMNSATVIVYSGAGLSV